MVQAGQQLGGIDPGFTTSQGTSTQGEVQRITGTASGGTFRLQFGDQQTSILPRNESAANIQTALRALSNISATGVSCTGGPLATSPVDVTFAAEYAAVDVPLLRVVNIDLSGGTITVAQQTAMASVPFFDADMNSISAMRARLAAISGTTYTSAVLDKMTVNDMMYALRVHDAPQSF